MAAMAAMASALFGSYDLHMAKQWRDEDVAFRDQTVQWLSDDTARAHAWRAADAERHLRAERVGSEHRACVARLEQLAAVSEQSVLLCGFTIAALTNLDVPREVPEALLLAYATAATLVCVSLLTAALQCTTLLLAVARYAGHGALEQSVKRLPRAQLLAGHSPFAAWWARAGEREQTRACQLMLLGVSLFFAYLALLAWIQFRHSAAAASAVSGLCLAGFLTWQLRVASKWRYLLLPASAGEREREQESSSEWALRRSEQNGGRDSRSSSRLLTSVLASPVEPPPAHAATATCGSSMLSFAHRKLSMSMLSPVAAT